jgi:hypothetical protein
VLGEYYFEIVGSRKTGNYKIIGYEKKVEHTICGNTRSGLKESRQWIGKYLLNVFGEDKTIKASHSCFKPGRDSLRNDVFHWNVDQYQIGTPPENPKYPKLSAKALSARDSIDAGRKL